MVSRSPVLVLVPRRILFHHVAISGALDVDSLDVNERNWLSCFDISSAVVPLFGGYHIIRAVQGTGSLTCARGVQQVRKYAPSALRLAHASEPHLVHGWPRRESTPFYSLYVLESGPRLILVVINWLKASHGLSVLLMVCAPCSCQTFFNMPDLASRSTAHALAGSSC